MKKTIFLLMFTLLFLCEYILKAQGLNTWEELGPFGKLQSNTTTPSYCGIGQLYCVETHPTDINTLYIGSPGGIWKTTDGGQNFTPFATGTEFDHTTGVGNVVVDYTDDNIIFASTGSRTRSRVIYVSPEQATSGIYRCQVSGSTKTWTNISTGLPNMGACYRCADAPTAPNAGWSNIYREIGYRIHILKQSPLDPNVVYAGTSLGLYVCTNAKAATPTWSLVSAIPVKPIYSVEFTKNSTPSSFRCHVTGDNVNYSSTDLVNWTNLTGTCSNCIDLNAPSFLTDIGGAASVDFYTLQATPSHKYPNEMYFGIRISGSTGSARYFLKHDGTSWVVMKRATYNTGYDPIVAAQYNTSFSPYERVVMGFEYIDMAVENGSGYSLLGNYSGYSTSSAPHSHADIMDVCTSIDNRYIYCANDGMLSKFDPINYSGTTAWQPMNNNGLSLVKSWFLAIPESSSSTIACGSFDNGTLLYRPSNGWKTISTGYDGSDVIFTKAEEVIYAFNYPETRKSVPPIYHSHATSGYGNTTWGNWGRMLYNDPKDPSVDYRIGSTPSNGGIYKIVNGNISNAAQLANHVSGMTGSCLALAPGDRNYVYLTYMPWFGHPPDSKSSVWFTTTGLQQSSSWTKLTSLPTANENAADWLKTITVSDLNPTTIFIGYEAAYDPAGGTRARIYKSTNGGSSWADYNNSQTSIPARYRIYCLLYEKGSNDGIYAGTDNGVYYTNKNMSSWIRYCQGLPNIPVTELLYHPHDNKIVVSTWGRGIWKVAPYCLAPSTLTINDANIATYADNPVHVNGTITYSANTSSNSPARRVELRSTSKVVLSPGTFYIPSTAVHTYEAYITPCAGTSSFKMDHSQSAGSDISLVKSQEPSTLESFTMESKPEMKIYPNPIEGDRAKLYIGDYINTKLFVQMIDMKGEVVFQTIVKSPEREVELIMGNNIPGTYLLRVFKVNDNKELYNTKVIIIGTTSGNNNQSSDKISPKNKKTID